MRLSPDNSATALHGLVLLAAVAIIGGLGGRLAAEWRDSRAGSGGPDGNCVYQVADEEGCIGTVAMRKSASPAEILAGLGLPVSGLSASLETKVPCGSRIRVTRTPPAMSMEKIPGANLVAMGKRINIDRADPTDLAAIPGIGPELAARIISHRDSGGALSGLYALQGIPGIGSKKRHEIQRYIDVGSSCAIEDGQ